MNKKTLLTIITIVMLAVAVLFVGCTRVAAKSTPQFATASSTARAPVYFIDAGDAVVVTFDHFRAGGTQPSGGVVRTAAEFVYMMRDTGSTTYTLANDFYVTALMWEALSDYTTQRSITIKGGYTETQTVAGEEVTVAKRHRITYAPNLEAASAVYSTAQYGGFFAQFNGKLESLEYLFRGKLEVDMYKIGPSVVYYGGFAGKLTDAYITDCELTDGGSILCYANKSGCTIYAGGIAGYMDGTIISDSTVTVGGDVSVKSFEQDDDESVPNHSDDVGSTRNNKLYAGGVAAVCLNNTTISDSVVSARGAITTYDSCKDEEGSYNDDAYVASAGGLFSLGGQLTLTGCEVTLGGRVNASGFKYSAINGIVAGGMFGLAGSYSNAGVSAESLVLVNNNIIHLSATIAAVTSRENHKEGGFIGIGATEIKGGSVYHGGIVGKFNGALNHNSKFGNNAILYTATIVESAKYCNTDGKSYYGYLSGNHADYFNSWNKGNVWTVLEGDEETTTINVRQSTNDAGGADNTCGDVGVLMVFGGGRVKAEIDGGKLQFSAEQVYSPFDKWYANLTEPKDYTKSAGYHSGEVFTEPKEDINGNPYTKYVFRPQGGNKTVYAVFLTKEIKSAGTFVQWTEEMNKGLNKPWIVVNVTEDVVVTKGVNVVNDFKGKFYGNNHTITFQNGVQMIGAANFEADEVATYFTGAAEGDTAAGAGIFRVIDAGAVVRDFDLVFAGKMYGGTNGGETLDTYVAAGFLAGVNMGTITNVNLTVPQAGNLIVVSSAVAYGGGLVGIDNGTITNVNASIQGNYTVQSEKPILGGVIGQCNTTGTMTYSNFNVDVKGQLESYGNNPAKSSYTYAGGLVGICKGKLALDHVIVNVHDKSNMGGDVLVNTCANNIRTYAELIEGIESFKVATGTTALVDDLISDADDVGVGSSSAADFAVLKSNLSFVRGRIAASDKGNWPDMNADSMPANWATNTQVKKIPAQAWFERYVKVIAKGLDCNAPCASCQDKAKRAYFAAEIENGFGLTQVWAIGSYGQYAGDDTYGEGVNYISHFGSQQSVSELNDLHLNLIYVRAGTAEGSFEGGLHFTVPVEDSAHVFTGWYVDYNHTVMVADNLLSGNAFKPGDQAGGVWYSRVVNSMITEADELDVLATTTNAGQRYAGVTFTLGCDVEASPNFTPIGTETNPFNGTFDGKGYSVTFNGFKVTEAAVGFFGALGTSGNVKQVVVRVNSIGNLNGKVFGAVVGVNRGTVGQNSQNERVKAEIYCNVTGASVAGGIVGRNLTGGLVYNTETVIVGDEASDVQGKLTADNAGSYGYTVSAGAVGVNEGAVRNVKVTCEVGDEGAYENAVSSKNTAGRAYAGGLVGYNMGELYSGVVEVFVDDEGEYIAFARGNNASNSFSAILVGYNSSSDVDALWAVYQLAVEGFVTPYDNPLINGVSDSVGNRLVRYGYGSLSSEIYANTDQQPKGGNILFAASSDKVAKVPFYSYTHSLERGEPVVEAAGSYYSPAITTSTQEGLGGVTYYAVFADAEINTDVEYYKFVEMVNKGFKAYVGYIVRLNSGTALTLQATDARYTSVGQGDNVFVGSFDGSGVTVEIKSLETGRETVPMFGTIGATSEVCNFNMSVEPTVRFRLRYDYEGESVVGGLAYVNFGVIRNVVFKFQSGVYGDAYRDGDSVAYGGYATYAGGLVGYNAGRIANTSVSLNTGNVSGTNMAARMYGLYAGGLVGYNAPGGWIGSDAISSVVLVLDTDTLPAAAIGAYAAGGLVGLNEGTVANATVTVKGVVGAPKPVEDKFDMGVTSTECKVGAIAGLSKGTVYGTRVTVASSAVLRAAGGYLGGVVGYLDGGVVGEVDSDDSVTVYWQRALSTDAPAYFGGVAGYSTGDVRGASVNFEASVTGATYVGGVVGYHAGYVSAATVKVNKNVALSSSASDGYVGGLFGYNKGRADACRLTVNGVLGSASSHTVGGFAGYTEGVVSNSYVVLYNTVLSSSRQGLAVGLTKEELVEGEPKDYGVNAWAVAFNSDRTLASTSEDSGFNVLKIVGTEMVAPSLVKYSTRTAVRFSSNITSGLVWYTDISKLEKDSNSNTVFTADVGLRNCLYHLCAYDLEIDNVADLSNLYTFVNSADLFSGVMFKLINDIVVPYASNVQPIGSLAYPFTGIFEGDGHTITFQSGSIVVGSQVSGLFGCIAEEAVVRNFVLQVDEGVLIGSTTDYVGSLAGYIYGSVSDVAVNLISAPRSSKEGAVVGALAGYVGASATFRNVWVVNYNLAVANPVGEDLSAGDYNVIDVYGRGVMRVVRRDADWQNEGVMQFDVSAIEGVDYFDNWYSDFHTSTVFTSGLGDFRTSSDGGVIVSTFYRPLRTLTARRFTASFIKMVITSEQDFYNFASNINTYGVKDGQFRFDLGRNVTSLTIDLSKMQPIGTAAHPFQATLDGSVTSFANPDSYAYTLVLKGTVQNADYSGLFGYVGEGAAIRNLVVRADNVEAQSIGYRESIYTGFFAAYIQGSAAHPVTLESVVVGVNRNTTLVNSHADAIGGVAGLWGNYVNVSNTWVVLPENGAYQALGSCRTPSGIQEYVETFADTYAIDLPNTMYLCGDGLINYTHRLNESTGKAEITFDLTSGEQYPFGFIEKLKDLDLDQANLPHSMTATVEDGRVGKVYLALYIKTTVDSEADLQYIADLVNVQNRSYLGVTFTLTRDITLSSGEWTPIGGAVETYVGSGEYKQVAFIGAFDGNGYTITMPQGLTCRQQYAGLFGILSSSARIRNLRVVCNAAVGGAATQYAGVLAGVDQGARLRNIIVDLGGTASVTANMSTARVAVNRALTYDVNGKVTNYASVNKADNVWVLNRNSRFAVEHNLEEQAFFDDLAKALALDPDLSAPFAASGVFNGGVNVVTVIANGTVDVSFNVKAGAIVGVVLRNAAATVKPIRMWYTAPEGVVTPYAPLYDAGEYANEYITDADSSVSGLVLYASFLNEFISTAKDLVELSVDVGEGCDLYGLTFYLESDVVIDQAAVEQGFIAIGTETTPFSATFNGKGHTVTLAEGTLIEGKTAGIFGVLGADGTIANVKFDLQGTLGRADYTATEVEAGKVNTLYAGAIAVSYGRLDSVIIDATALKARALQYGYAVASVAYDYGNDYTNTWLIVSADNTVPYFGWVASANDSTINVMRVIGMGRLAATFRKEENVYYVQFANDRTYTQTVDGVVYSYTIRGWYSDFSGDNQLSQALNVTALNTGITAGDDGAYLAAADIFNSRFEVAIMSRIIVSEDDLIAIAEDVNEGGYTFENTTFTLGHDVVVSSVAFQPIGTAATPFMGTFQGAYNGNFYKIVMARQSIAANGQPTDAGVALFGEMRGVVENIIVELTVDVPTYNSVTGVIAQYNYGVVRNALVRMYRFAAGYAQPVTVYGTTVGGVVGANYGTVGNCIVYISPRATLNATYSVGGLVGQNEGMVMGSTSDQFDDWRRNPVAYATLSPWYEGYESVTRSTLTLSSVLLDGSVKVVNSLSSETLFAGGAVGESRNRATINRVTVRISSTGSVTASGGSVEVGGLAGRSLATLANSVLLSEGTVGYTGTPNRAYSGHFIGNLQGSAPNCWLVVPVPPTVTAIGNGSSVNVLQINGSGFIDAYLDGSDNIIFRDLTPLTGAALDGWYVSTGIQVPDDVGGVDDVSFRPNRNITGYTVNVIFINTQINTVEDLVAMATTVNAGLFSTGLTFTLNDDLTIDVASSPLFRELTIGTALGESVNAFKHVFEGNGYTITVVNGDNNVYGGAYVGLFGYTGQDAVIRNLTLVVESGTYGVAGTTQVLGALVCHNNGTVENCHVYLGCAPTATGLTVMDVPTRLIAAKVGGVVGENFGTITSVTVTSYAALQAETTSANATSNEYVGGVVGNNRGTVSSIDVYIYQPAGGFRAMYAASNAGTSGTSYVGGVAGNNAIEISNVYVSIDSAFIESRSAVQAYAGGVAGSNTGFIKNGYVAWNKVSMVSDNAAGGVVGTNNNNLAAILIDFAVGSVLTANADSAVANTGNYGTAANVWVFNRNDALDSRSPAVNNMTVGTAALIHNDPAEVRRDGRIYFEAAIGVNAGLTVYADADTAYKTVRLDDFIAYNGGRLRLTSHASMTGVHVRSEIRNTVGDQTELKAIARALRENGQDIKGTYTMTDDVTVDGDYYAIGASSGAAFSAVFQGDMHRITFTEAVTFKAERSLFGVMSGTVNGVVVEYFADMSADQAAGIAHTNNGALRDVVVYTADGVTLSHPTYVGGTPLQANGEIWIVSRERMSASSVNSTNRYGVIVVNGNGTLDVERENGALYFTARSLGAATTFAGYSDFHKMLKNVDGESNRLRFNVITAVNNNNTMSFTAEFLSTDIATGSDFEDLLGLLNMAYAVDSDTTFTLVADISVEAEGLAHFASFTGVLDGAFHTLTVVGDVDQAFGALGASLIQNIVIDATDLTGDKYLFAAGASARLTRVVVRRQGAYGNLQATSNLTYQYVYVVSPDPACHKADRVGLIVETDVPTTFRMGDRFMQAVAGNSDDLYFVGWYTLDGATHFKAEALDLSGTSSYVSCYLSKTIRTSTDVAGLAEAVNKGYDFAGLSFTVESDVAYTGASIGSATVGADDPTYFAGVIEGNGHVLTLTAPLFTVFNGTLKNAKVATSSQEGLATLASGEFRNVVVVSSAASARFASSVSARLTNCWLVASSGTPEATAGVKTVRLGANVTLSVDVTDVSFTASPTSSEYFLLWRDKAGKVIFNEAYDTLVSSVATADYYSVEGTSEVATDDEYAYFAMATAHGYTSEVTLSADIHVYASTPVMTDAFKLDGNGHTVFVNAPVALSVLTARSGENSHIYNVVFVVADSVTDFVLTRIPAGLTNRPEYINVAVKASEDARLDVTGVYDNVWLLVEGDMRAPADLTADYAALPAGLNVMLYDKGDLTVSFSRTGSDVTGMSVTADDREGRLHFLGYYDTANHTDAAFALTGTSARVEAFFADKVLSSSAEWSHAALAMRLTGNVTPSFTLAADVVADASFVPFTDYAGTLDGAFFSVVVKENANLFSDGVSTGVVELASGGSVRHLAVEVERGYLADPALTWFASPAGATVEECVLVNYTDKVLLHPDGTVRMLTVVDQGEGAGYVRVDKRTVAGTEHFAFVARNTAEYSLRYYEMGGTDYDVDDANSMNDVVFAVGETADVKAKFFYCYTVYVDVDGAPAELVTDAHVTPGTPYWLGFAYTEPTVEFKKVVQGYLFAGFSYADEALPAIDLAHSTYTKLAINVDRLIDTGSITITARFILIESEWSEVTYGDKTLAEIDDYLKPSSAVMDVIRSDADFTYNRQDTPDSNVMSDFDTPYHAGGYVIRFNVYHDGTLVGRSDGLSFQITPRPLYFENLRVSVKKYDGNANARIEFAELGGFSADDVAKGCRRQYSIKDSVTLEYFDLATGEAMSNAGTWYLRVKEGSYVDSNVLNGTVLFNDDYVLPEGALYMYAETATGYVRTDNLYVGIISKQDLELVVSDVSVFYLDQFGTRTDSGDFVPFDIYEYLSFEWSGTIYGADSELLGSNTKLLRVVGDRTTVTDSGDVKYSYTIRSVGSYSIEVIKDVLVNYEPKISENKATFTVKPSPATVVLNDMDLQYGDTLTALNYTVRAAGAVTYFTEEERAALAAAKVYTNLDAADWFAMTLVPEYAVVGGANMSFATAPIKVDADGHAVKAGVQYRFTADNRNFVLADASATMVINGNNQKEYVLTADGVLTITARHIVYNVTSDVSKPFGSEDTVINGRSVGKALMNGDKLRFTREKGEAVGTYAITASVVDKDGKDVTSNYVLEAYNGADFRYAITRRTVVVQRTGNGVFNYGSDALQEMPFSTNLSDSVKARIMSAFDVSKKFDASILITVGYFGSDALPVGRYDNATLSVQFKNVSAALVNQSLDFVLEEKSRSYEIIRASLTVSAVDVNRVYDMTDNLTGASIEVTGWANGDGKRLAVRVGRYVCDGLTAAAGTYFYEPADLTLYDVKGDTGLLDNYVIGTVVGAKYVISRVAVTMTVSAGTYDEEGAFTADDDGFIPFGDNTMRWNFALVGGDLPEYMAAAYEEADLTTDLERSEWLRQHFAIVARSIASLPAGTIMASGSGANYYMPYSADSNVTITLTADSYFRIDEIAIVITDVRFASDSAKTEPTMSFTVAAYSHFVRNEDGTVEVSGEPIEGYFSETSVSGVRSGQRVTLNDNYAVSFSFTAYNAANATYNLSSYVNDGAAWVTYREASADPILFVQQTDEDGEKVLVSYNRALTDEVNVREGFWSVLGQALADNPVPLAIAIVGFLALVAVGVVGALLYKRRRLFARAQRDMHYEDVFATTSPSAEGSDEDVFAEDAVPAEDAPADGADGTPDDTDDGDLT